MAASKLDEVVSLAKRRGFVFPAGEIYGGTRSAWDYGPLGVALKDNIKREWWRSMVVTRGDVVGVDFAGRESLCLVGVGACSLLATAIGAFVGALPIRADLSARSGIRPTSEFLLSLGSDVPYMYEGGEARVTGCGESVERLPFVKRSVLLVLPSGGADTAKAYALYDQGVISPGDNHLFAAACRLCPETGRAAEALSLAGARRVVMSGSGSAVCAFFGDEQEAERVKRALPRDLDCVLLHTVDALVRGSVDL